MVTLVILAVLLAIAAPSYRDFVLDSRMSGEANEFLTALNFARSEAIKRNGRVTMCKSSTGTACATSGYWDQGWIVFVDVDSGTAGTFDSGSDTILRVHAALTAGSTLKGNADAVANYASFVPDGRSLLANGAAQAGDFDLCVSGASAQGRQVGLALGRSQVSKIACP